MSRYDAVLFDLDGTLIDSQPGITACFAHVFAQYGLHPSAAQLRRYLGPPLRDSFAELLPAGEVENAVKAYRARYAVDGIYNCALYPGVERMLRTLKENDVAVCLATSKPQVAAGRILTHFAIDRWFDYIGGASLDASLDTKTAVMQDVLRQPVLRGRHPLMVGDRENDMQGARDCALPAAAVLYGYGPREELAPYRPVFFAHDTDELCRWVLEQA